MLRTTLAATAVLLSLASPARAEDVVPVALGLEEASSQLDAQNLTLAQARSRAAEARAVVRQASAPLLPTFAVTGSYARNSDEARVSMGEILGGLAAGIGQATGRPIPLDFSGAPDLIIQPLESFNAGASLRVPLFAANAYWDRASARHAADSADASVGAVRLQLRLALTQAAWFASAVEQRVAATERALATAREHAANADRSVKAGALPPLARLQAETDVVRRESELARARADRDHAWLALGTLLGRSEPVRIAMPALAPAAGLDVPALLAEAERGRPELRARQASLEAAQSGLDSARWRVAPGLSAGFSALAASVPFPTGDRTGWRASLDLTWPLYDGGYRYGRADQAEAALAGARSALEAQRLEVAQQVRDAVREVAVARERLRLAQRQKALADEASAQANASFKAGVASSLDALDANDRAWLADVGLAEATARVGASEAALAQAIGRAP